MPGPSSISRTWSRETVELISACDPARSTIAMSSAPEPARVRWKPCAIARNYGRTTTTSATDTTVESDSHRRCEMLLRLIFVTAAICSRREPMVSAPPQSGRDLQPHRIEGRNDPGDETEREHQRDPAERDPRRDRKAGDELRHAVAQRIGDQCRQREARQAAEQSEEHRLAEH